MFGKTSSREGKRNVFAIHACRGLIDSAVRQGLWVVATPRWSQPFQTSTTAHRMALLANGAVHVTRLRWILLLMATPRSLMYGEFHRRQNGPTLMCGATRATAMGGPHWT